MISLLLLRSLLGRVIAQRPLKFCLDIARLGSCDEDLRIVCLACHPGVCIRKAVFEEVVVRECAWLR
jgi:hypothetical protein